MLLYQFYYNLYKSNTINNSTIINANILNKPISYQ